MFRVSFLAGMILAIACATSDAKSAQINIVALGASNTAGLGVGMQGAYPALLQSMLRARGYDANVSNAGVSGNTTAGMLSRLDVAVPAGTQFVILDQAPLNDELHGLSGRHSANVNAIVSRLHARKIKTIVIPAIHARGGNLLQSDGIHLTAEGQARVAAHLLPLVISSVGKK